MPLASTGRRTGSLAALVTAAALVPALTLPALARPAAAAPGPGDPHVLLISVDGMHQSDLAGYVRTHPRSALAALAGSGTDYTHAATPVPSDSFPGMLGQVTGGTPASTGVYYDNGYDRDLLPPGTTSCGASAKRGADAVFDESIDRNPDALDAGQGLPNLPDGILAMTGRPRSVINPAKLPVDPATCAPVFPHQFTRANTLFEVAHAHGRRTAWSDKHPAYDLLAGPSGNGIDDLFTPEINSRAPGGGDWTTDNAATRRYDAYKVTAVRNEIDGFDHSRATRVGVPAIMGLNFQTVSTAQKLPTSDGQTGGYLADGVTPGPLLAGALDFVDAQIASMVAELKARHLDGSTTVVVSAKHGQAPMNPTQLNRIDDGPILDGLNAAWTAAHPGAAALVVHSADDDGLYLWLSDRSPVATRFAVDYLDHRSGTGTDIAAKPRPYVRSGLDQVLAGADAARFFHVPATDSRVPDLVGIVVPGVVYTGGTSKIAEHGGALREDRNVPIVVTGPGHGDAPGEDTDSNGDRGHRPRTEDAPVSTTQIAPTILRALGLDPRELRAVRAENTPLLP